MVSGQLVSRTLILVILHWERMNKIFGKWSSHDTPNLLDGSSPKGCVRTSAPPSIGSSHLQRQCSSMGTWQSFVITCEGISFCKWMVHAMWSNLFNNMSVVFIMMMFAMSLLMMFNLTRMLGLPIYVFEIVIFYILVLISKLPTFSRVTSPSCLKIFSVGIS